MTANQSNLMPVLFLGHGNPMNAIQESSFTKTLNGLGETLPRPKAILCISAHWMTKGTWITHMANPKTIHDFYGFPRELFDVQYPAPGCPELAELVTKSVQSTKIQFDEADWGFDHGTWSILKHMYPKADVPIVQLSVDNSESPRFHYNIGKELFTLREQGYLIIGSGNIVHNLGQIDFSPNARPLKWATHFDSWVKNKLVSSDNTSLLEDALKLPEGKLSIPTTDHWYPLLYILGATHNQDNLKFEYEGIEHGSISMCSFSYS